MGPVGCGKSSILSAILAELSMHSGEISISQIESGNILVIIPLHWWWFHLSCQGFGYVTQQAWLQRGTLRDNILFGKPFDEPRYKQVLSACGLLDDLAVFPHGDLTGVGEGGVTLSGGQRTRVALARAVYQDKWGLTVIKFRPSRGQCFPQVCIPSGWHFIRGGSQSCQTYIPTLHPGFAEGKN